MINKYNRATYLAADFLLIVFSCCDGDIFESIPSIAVQSSAQMCEIHLKPKYACFCFDAFQPEYRASNINPGSNS